MNRRPPHPIRIDDTWVSKPLPTGWRSFRLSVSTRMETNDLRRSQTQEIPEPPTGLYGNHPGSSNT